MSLAVLFILLFVLLLLGVPVAIALGISSLICLLLFTSHDITGIPDIFIAAFKPHTYGDTYVYPSRLFA